MDDKGYMDGGPHGCNETMMDLQKADHLDQTMAAILVNAVLKDFPMVAAGIHVENEGFQSIDMCQSTMTDASSNGLLPGYNVGT